MANITLLPSAKVPLIYDGELTMTTEWYRFFWNIYGFTGTGVIPVDKGGTGLDTIGDHQLIIGNANNVFEPALLSSASIAITYPAGFINLELGTSGVTPGTYGSASQVGVFTVNAYGVLTAASNTSIGIDASQIISGTLPVIRGGTGQSTYTDGQLLIGNSTGNTLNKGTLGYGTGLLVTNGAGTVSVGFSNSAVATWAATPSSANLAAAMTDETGSGLVVFNTAPSISALTIDGASPYIQFNNGAAVALAAGRMWYNGLTGSWNLGMGNGNITQQVGEEFFRYGKASSAISDTNLQLVYKTGVVGASGVITFAPAVAGITDPDQIIGIATESIATNGFGRVTTMGVVNGINTTGSVYGETWADNDDIWYNPVTGGLTKVKPVAPNIKVQIGTVINAGSGGSGSFNVNKGSSSALGGTDSNVQLASLANANILTYDGLNAYWRNTILTAGTGVTISASTTGVLTINATGTGGTVTSVSGTSPISVATGTTTPVISISQANTSTNGYLSSTDWNTFNNKQPAGSYLTAVSVVSANGFAGTSSGGTTPALTLSTTITGILKGNGTAISAATSGTDYAPATSGSSILYGNGAGGFSNVTIGTGVSFAGGTLSATGSGGTVTSVAALTLGTTGTDLSSTVANSTTTPVITLNVPTASATNRGALSAADWTTFNGKAPAVTYTTNYIPYGQGTTTPNQSSGLQFDGTNFTTTGNATAKAFIPSSSTIPSNGLFLLAANTLGFSTSTTNQAMLDANGNFGVGTGNANPVGRFESQSTRTTALNTIASFATLPIQATDNTALAAGIGGGIAFRAKVTSTTYNPYAAIWCSRQVATVSDYKGDLIFGTSDNATGYPNERMRIFSSGGVSIGNTTDAGVGSLLVNKVVSVGGATPTTSGAGITFPATQSASTDVNTLDDYEEGTWTPSVSANVGTITTVGTVVGSYTKIGRQVCAMFDCTITTNGTGSSYIKIGGLPFASVTYVASGAGKEYGVTDKSLNLVLSAGSTTIAVFFYDGAYPGGNNYRLLGTITYFV